MTKCKGQEKDKICGITVSGLLKLTEGKRLIFCPIRKECHRFTAKGNKPYQWYFNGLPYDFKKDECKQFRVIEQ